MVPKYIQQKIERHNLLLKKAILLENEIDEWYEKQVDKYSSIAEDVSDEDIYSIKSGETATFIAIENIKYNLNLFYQLKRGA